jgi:hypothetical protein
MLRLQNFLKIERSPMKAAELVDLVLVFSPDFNLFSSHRGLIFFC